MNFSSFGEKFCGGSGIGNLMDDLGNAMAGDEPVLMLGGGNPGRIPEIESRLWQELERMAGHPDEFARIAGAYDEVFATATRARG